MNNHVHWILTPPKKRSLARLFSRVHTWWAMYFNARFKRTRHLFQSRYHSSPMDEKHYWAALRYVELNPKKAKLIDRPEEWLWSSARAHTGRADHFIRLTSVVTRRKISQAAWVEFLSGRDPKRERNLERVIRCSRPCGSAAFVKTIEARCKRKLAWSPPKRPASEADYFCAA